MIRRMLSTGMLVVVGLALSAGAQTENPFHWSGKVAPENVVEIKNLNGRIEPEPASGDQIEVTADKSGSNEDQVRIVVVPHSEGVTICAIYPGGDDGQCTPGNSWHTSGTHGDRAKVDFRVRVPQNVRFSAMDVNGDVVAQDMGRQVRASSVNGSVRVTTKSWAEVSSVNGSVDADMGAADWTGTLKISTVNGSIHLRMPSNLSTEVRFSTVNGKLNSDLPLTMRGSMSSRHVEGQIGGGGRKLELETVNGSVDLRSGTM